MIITDQRILQNVKVIPPRTNVLNFRIEQDGTIQAFDIYLSAPLTGFGSLYFGVRLNGVNLFASYPADYINIVNDSDHGEKTGLSVDVVKGDIISLDVLGNARSDIGAVLTFMAHISTPVQITEKIWIPTVGVNGTTPGPVFDLPASNAPTPIDVTGTNIHKGALSFADSGLQTAQLTLLLPSFWTGAISLKYIWYTTATSGNCKWFAWTAFTGTGATATDDPSFNSSQNVITAAPGTGSRITNSIISALTLTGSAAGSLFHLKIGRDGTDGSDTIGAAAIVIGVELTISRLA